MKTISLGGCTSLVSLPDSLTRLKQLRYFSARDCPALVALPDAFGDLCSLDSLYLCGCHREECSAIRRRRRRICDVCGAFAGKDQRPFPVCGGCDARRYCGEACQIADWEAGHARKCGAAIRNEIFDALTDDEV